jgi:RNA polymerase sigma-70 factor (sigma-E family)
VIALSAPEGSRRPPLGPAATPAPAVQLGEFARTAGVELLRFAYLLCGDRHRAEDLLQDVFLALHRRFGDSLPLDNPLAYTRRALANANVSRSRRATNSELPIAELPETAADAPDDPADRDELWQALRRLPARQRTVLVLRYYADASDDEIARAVGCRRATVRSLVFRGLATMRSDPTVMSEGAP